MSRRNAVTWGAVATAVVLAAVTVGANGGVTATYVRLRVRLTAGRTTTYRPVGAGHLATPGPAPHPPTGPMSVVVLGDSVPAGNFCGCTPFGEVAAQLIADVQDRDVTVHNFAIGGSTSADTLEQIRRPDVAKEVAGADLVIVETGANDFDPGTASTCKDVLACYGDQLAETSGNIAAVTSTAKRLLTNPSAQISLIGYWNVFTDGQVGRGHGQTYQTVSDELTRRLNEHILGIARNENVSYPDVYAAFKGAEGSQDPTRFLAVDGDHPNADGHRLMADTVLGALGRSVGNL